MTATLRRTISIVMALALTAAITTAAAPAQAQLAPPDAVYLTANGAQVQAVYQVSGRTANLTQFVAPIGELPPLKSFGWSGSGRFVVTARGPGARCQIVAQGGVVADTAGDPAVCAWP